jgi:colanic acid biosynthesis glycosyl transferase WcaI
MKILVYGLNFSPEPTGIGKYSGEMAEWFAQQGHSVRVVTAPPYYPAWKCDPEYAWPPYRRERWRGVDVWRAPLWIPKVPGGVSRVLHLLSFAVSSFPLMLAQILWRPDVVLTIAPAFVCAPAGWLTARLAGGKCWLHLQDFEIDVAFQMGLLSSKWLQRVVLCMERWVLRRFDSVSSISNRMVDRLRAKGVLAQRAHYFPNWVDISKVRPSIISTSYRDQLRISYEAVVVMFSGSLCGKQGLMVIPQAAALLAHNKDIVFVVCGDGVMKPQLEEAAANLKNIRVLPLQPLERLGELLCTADIHLLPQSPGAADLVLPSKLPGMLASGRPVIATCDAGTEIADVISNCGVVVPPEDGAALAEAICTLASDPSARRELGRRARACAVAHFDRDEVLGRVFAAAGATGEIAVDRVAAAKFAPGAIARAGRQRDISAVMAASIANVLDEPVVDAAAGLIDEEIAVNDPVG